MQLPPIVAEQFQQFMAGKITFDELSEAGAKVGVKFAIQTPLEDRNPHYPIGDNRTRSGFTHHLKSKKGSAFQRVIKQTILKSLNLVHSWATKEWDADSFVYDDKRLQALNDTSKEFINTYFDQQERKIDIMSKLVDVCLWMLKEDIYYCPRVLLALNNLPYFVITKKEEENIKTFTKGVYVVNAANMKPVENHPGNLYMPKQEDRTTPEIDSRCSLPEYEQILCKVV